MASPQQGDLKLSGPSPGQGAGGGARTRDRKVPADLRADSLAIVPDKTYEDKAEEGDRFAIFMRSVKFIEHHNWKYHNQLSSFYLDINHFSDLSDEEFNKMNGLKMDPRTAEPKCPEYHPKTTQVPEQVDWREKGYVTPVKDQVGNWTILGLV
ncbi:cathepsin-l [Plakobranchus ocellatus]|uniref:Cathepsin-l n=1 Tax=Plakobranchus ocellatus TaxID=259542 RepID=A0AAV4A720_9GAST|nr:cathepsin-l [Plakobranchus ocellatus]